MLYFSDLIRELKEEGYICDDLTIADIVESFVCNSVFVYENVGDVHMLLDGKYNEEHGFVDAEQIFVYRGTIQDAWESVGLVFNKEDQLPEEELEHRENIIKLREELNNKNLQAVEPTPPTKTLGEALVNIFEVKLGVEVESLDDYGFAFDS